MQKGALRFLTQNIAALVSCATASVGSGNVIVGAGELQSKADAGDAKAAYTLGMRYFLGEQIARSRDLAKQYLTRAAEAGDLRAMNMLGLMSDPLWSDDPTTADTATAVAWYRRAAMQGYEAALNNLSELKKRGYIKSELENPAPSAIVTAGGVPLSVREPTQQPSIQFQAPIQPSSQNQGVQRPLDGRDMFKARSSALVEILGDGNYGSGVILGTLWNRGADAILRTAQSDVQVNYPFISTQGAGTEITSLPVGSYLLVVSNAHVMEGSRRMDIGYGVDQRGQTLFKKPMMGVCFPIDNGVDLALYFVPVEESELALNSVVSFAPLAPPGVVPETGSRIFAIANPERMARSIAQGMLSGLRPDLIQFDAPISKGSSGGAIFDERGNLLGIIFGYLDEVGAQNLNFAIPADRIRPLMMGAGAMCYRSAQIDDPQTPVGK